MEGIYLSTSFPYPGPAHGDLPALPKHISTEMVPMSSHEPWKTRDVCPKERHYMPKGTGYWISRVGQLARQPWTDSGWGGFNVSATFSWRIWGPDSFLRDNRDSHISPSFKTSHLTTTHPSQQKIFSFRSVKVVYMNSPTFPPAFTPFSKISFY